MSPVITDAKIVETYNQIEATHGGPQSADAKTVLRETADHLGVSYAQVRDVILREWGAQG